MIAPDDRRTPGPSGHVDLPDNVLRRTPGVREPRIVGGNTPLCTAEPWPVVIRRRDNDGERGKSEDTADSRRHLDLRPTAVQPAGLPAATRAECAGVAPLIAGR